MDSKTGGDLTQNQQTTGTLIPVPTEFLKRVSWIKNQKHWLAGKGINAITSAGNPVFQWGYGDRLPMQWINGKFRPYMGVCYMADTTIQTSLELQLDSDGDTWSGIWKRKVSLQEIYDKLETLWAPVYQAQASLAKGVELDKNGWAVTGEQKAKREKKAAVTPIFAKRLAL